MQQKKTKQKASSKGLSKQTAPKMPKESKRLSTSSIEYIIVFLFSVLLYSNTLFFKYALDDGLVIMDNKITMKGLSGIKEMFTKDLFYGVYGDNVKIELPGGRYRPISQVMFAVEYQIFGLNPFIGHFFNIILYGLLCLLLLKVLKIIFERYTSKQWYLSVPFIATIIFACHPLHTEVVANIKGRDEILSLLFSLGTLYLILKYIQTKKWSLLVYSFLVFVLALLSKENSITFLALIPLTIFFLYKETLKQYLLAMLPLATATLFYFVLRFNALGFGSVTAESTELLNNPFVNVIFSEKIATIMLTWGKYLLLVLFPHPLTHDYYPKQIPIVGFTDFRAIISLVLYLALIGYSVVRIWKRDVFAYAILLFLITFSISSNLVFNIGTFMNERFMFAPLLGFAIIIAVLIHKYLNKDTLKVAAQVAIVVIVALFSIKAYTRNFAWKDSLTLYSTDVKTSANSAKVNVGTGELLLKTLTEQTPETELNSTIDKALVFVKRGLEIYPGFKAGWIYLGYGLHLKKDYINSRLALIEALKLDSNDYDAKNYLYNDALTCYHAKNYAQAEANFKTLIQYVPEHTEYEYFLAEVYSNNAKVDSALIILKQIVSDDPKNDKAFNKLGEVYGRILNQLDSSIYYLNKGYAVNPKNLDVIRNLGTAHGIRRDFENSLRYLLEAEAIAPTDKDVLEKLYITYKNMGNEAKTKEYAVKALQ